MAIQNSRWLKIALVVALSYPFPSGPDVAQQGRGAFRSRVVLVPVDVRVLDQSGNPVTDLQPEEFRIFDEDQRQEIAHFSTHAFAPSTERVAAPRLRETAGLETTPVTRRTFVIVLGRGRLERPANGLAATIDFVENRLLPQDQLGVIAYSRAFGLTSDSAAVARLLRSYRDRHYRIETRLRFWFSGLQARYGSRTIPPGIQALMDDVFDAADVRATRSLAVGSFGDAAYDAIRRELDDEGDRAGYDDLRALFGAVQFLRYFEGEKHVIYVAQRPLALPGRRTVPLSDTLQNIRVVVGVEAGKQVDSLAHLAADARVAISVVQTGGLASGNVQDGRFLAEHTGGVASFSRYASEAFGRLDRATRFQYLLGYYPAAARWRGEYRRIRVEVTRPGASVQYRRGYKAEEELVPYDRRAFMASNRILAAASDNVPIRDVGVDVSAPEVVAGADGVDLQFNVVVEPDGILLRQEGDRRIAALHLAAFVGDADEAVVGEMWRQVDLVLEGESLERFEAQGLVLPVSVTAAGQGRYIKIVVYDYLADRLGVVERAIGRFSSMTIENPVNP